MTAEGKVHRNILQKAVSLWDYVKLHIVTDVFWMKITSPNSSAVHILLTAEKLNFTSTFIFVKVRSSETRQSGSDFPWCFSQTFIIIFKFPFLILFHCIFKIHKQHKNWKSKQNSQSLRVHILQQSPVRCLTRSTKHVFPLLLRTKSHTNRSLFLSQYYAEVLHTKLTQVTQRKDILQDVKLNFYDNSLWQISFQLFLSSSSHCLVKKNPLCPHNSHSQS